MTNRQRTRASHVVGTVSAPDARRDPMLRLAAPLTDYAGDHAHRKVYMACRGELPSEVVLHHECRNKGCVNPNHLRPMLSGDHTAMHAAERRKQ